MEHPLLVIGSWEIISEDIRSEKKQSLGILFGEALFTHLGKHFGGGPVPKHAQFRKQITWLAIVVQGGKTEEKDTSGHA